MQEVLSQAISNVAVALVGLGAAYAIYYIKKATQKIKAETEKIENENTRNALYEALDSLDDIAVKTVASIEQKTAKALRDLVKDGKAEREELLELSKQAYDEILEELKPEYKAVLEKNVANFENYVLNTIESNVLKVKSAR